MGGSSNPMSFFKGIPAMLKSFIAIREAALRLRDNQDGVVSFEYVMVAACIVGAVALAFGTDSGGAIKNALTSAIGVVVGKLPT